MTDKLKTIIRLLNKHQQGSVHDFMQSPRKPKESDASDGNSRHGLRTSSISGACSTSTCVSVSRAREIMYTMITAYISVLRANK
jgi:hypothetical protein